jgi:hypothetical protein
MYRRPPSGLRTQRGLLVGERGWTPERFGTWLADAWIRFLLP